MALKAQEFKLVWSPRSDAAEHILRYNGCEPRNWQFKGVIPEVRVEENFLLLPIVAPKSLAEVAGSISSFGSPAESFWQVAFATTFPASDEEGRIAILDPVWIDKYDRVNFPVLDELKDPNRPHLRTYWHLHFDTFTENCPYNRVRSWRWLVKVRKQGGS